MNGRVYDYNLGRFMSVDPFIQSPGNTQSVNPYSYVMNNPLAYTDPTGYSAEDVEDVKTTTIQVGTETVGVLITTDSNGAQTVTLTGTEAGRAGAKAAITATVDKMGQADVSKQNSSGYSAIKEGKGNFGFQSGYSLAPIHSKNQKQEALNSAMEYTPLGQAIDTAAGVVEGLKEGINSYEKEGSLSSAVLFTASLVAERVSDRKLKKLEAVADKIKLLREGKDVRVDNVSEARDILDNMPEVKPGPGNIMPGLRDRTNTYRGDLINKQNPNSSQIHPTGSIKTNLTSI